MTEPIAIEETSRLIASDKVEGTTVFNRKKEKLGSILNFMVDKRGGNVQYAVLEFGGILGIGREYYPIPWQMLEYSETLDGYIVDIDKSKLENAPRIVDRHSVWDDIYGQEIFGYYGMPYPAF